MLISTNMIKEKLLNYKNKNTKISREAKKGKYIKIKNGLYETDSNTPGYCLASAIYSPSYLSFDFALAYYGLIPERVVNYTSATCGTGKKKTVSNYFGTYFYQDVPKKVYFHGIRIVEENGYYYQIATVEKALCDKLYTLSPVNNYSELEDLLFNNLRIDIEELEKFNLEDLLFLEERYHSTNVTFLYKYLRRNAK